MLDRLKKANVVRKDEWGCEGIDLSYRGNELAGETGEACNVLKKIVREQLGYVGSRATVKEAAEELADVVICVDLICSDLGIDLEQAIQNKFNKTSRKYRLKTCI